MRALVAHEARAVASLALVAFAATTFLLVAGAYEANGFGGVHGPARLDAAVATVRPGLVLVPSLAGLAAGIGAFGPGDTLLVATIGRGRHLAAVALGRALPLTLVFFAAAFVALGFVGATPKPTEAVVAFGVAHALLALSFLALALLARLAFARRGPAALSVGIAWSLFVVLWQDATFARVTQVPGRAALLAGQIPSWFLVAQAASPVTAYRGALVFWRHGYSDALEGFVLRSGAVPSWMSPALFVADLVIVWIALPMAIAWRLAVRRSW